MIDCPLDYIEKLKAENRQLRTDLIRARAELDDAGLAVATLVYQRKQLLDDFAIYRAKVKDTLSKLNEKTTLIDLAIENSII